MGDAEHSRISAVALHGTWRRSKAERGRKQQRPGGSRFPGPNGIAGRIRREASAGTVGSMPHASHDKRLARSKRQAPRCNDAPAKTGRNSFGASRFLLWQARRPQRPAGYSSSLSIHSFLCFGGLRRLSGMTRSGGGWPRTVRAPRRASLPAVNLRRFFAGLIAA